MAVEDILERTIPAVVTVGAVVHTADKLLYRDKKGKTRAPRENITDVWAAKQPYRGSYYVYGKLGRSKKAVSLGSRKTRSGAENLARQMKRKYGVR